MLKPLLVYPDTEEVAGPNYTVWAQRHLNINNYGGIKAADKRRRVTRTITRAKEYMKHKRDLKSKKETKTIAGFANNAG